MDDLSELDNSCIVETPLQRRAGTARQGRSPREHNRYSATHIEDCRTPLLLSPLLQFHAVEAENTIHQFHGRCSTVRRRSHQAQTVREVQSLSQLAFEDVNVAKISTLHYLKNHDSNAHKREQILHRSFRSQSLLPSLWCKFRCCRPRIRGGKDRIRSPLRPRKRQAAKSLFFRMTTGHHIVRPCLLMV